MLTVYFSFTVNPEVATNPIVVYTVDFMKLLKDGNCMVMLDGRHRRCSVEMLGDEDGEECAAEPLRTHYAFLVYGNPTS